MTNDAQKFEAFIEAYRDFVKSQEAIAMLNSEIPEHRIKARNYAIRYADKKQPGIEGAIDAITAAEMVNKPQAIDMLLDEAGRVTFRTSRNKFVRDVNGIAAQTPEDGLAKIVLDYVPAFEIRGDNAHNRIVAVHANYQKLTALMPKKDADGRVIMPDHGELYGVLKDIVQERVNARYDSDEDFRGDSKLDLLKENTGAVSRFLLASSPRLCLNGVVSLRKSYKDAFEAALPDKPDKAGYARKIIRGMLNADNYEGNANQKEKAIEKAIPDGMKIVYTAYEKSE